MEFFVLLFMVIYLYYALIHVHSSVLYVCEKLRIAREPLAYFWFGIMMVFVHTILCKAFQFSPKMVASVMALAISHFCCILSHNIGLSWSLISFLLYYIHFIFSLNTNFSSTSTYHKLMHCRSTAICQFNKLVSLFIVLDYIKYPSYIWINEKNGKNKHFKLIRWNNKNFMILCLMYIIFIK